MDGVEQIFPTKKGATLDFSQGVNVADLFNNFQVPIINNMEQLLFEDVDKSNQERATQQLKETRSDSVVVEEEARQFDEDKFQESLQLENTNIQSDRVELLDFENSENQPSSLRKGKLSNLGNFKVFEGSRDQIKNFSSTRGDRKIALDFNDTDDKSVRGIEIVLPRDATESEKAAARQWVKETHAFYKRNGIDVPIRRGDGLKIGGGKKGVIHTEPFFAANKKVRALIQSKRGEYAQILARTLGGINGATFIAPHERRGQGANADGVSERAFGLDIVRELSGLSRTRSSNRSSGKVDRGLFALEREQRLDSKGRLKIYRPKGSDKNNIEIAGFGDVTSGPQYKQLKRLVDAGKHDEARRLAGSFLTKRGEPFTNSTSNDTVASVINGVIHHRGEDGYRKIAQLMGIRANDSNIIHGIEKVARSASFETRWIAARRKQEAENEKAVWISKGRPGTLAGFRAKRKKDFGRGLFNRWKLEAQTIKKAA